jgi:hypothetical protein
MLIGLTVLLVVLGFAYWRDVKVQNNWLAAVALVGLIFAVPALVYGFYISVLHWKDMTGYGEGKSLLITAMVLSVIDLGGFSLGVIAFVVYYIARVRPELKRIAIAGHEPTERGPSEDGGRQ